MIIHIWYSFMLDNRCCWMRFYETYAFMISIIKICIDYKKLCLCVEPVEPVKQNLRNSLSWCPHEFWIWFIFIHDHDKFRLSYKNCPNGESVSKTHNYKVYCISCVTNIFCFVKKIAWNNYKTLFVEWNIFDQRAPRESILPYQ